ncbi:hypothetical protein A2V49_02705 [candidate division WWE3 bacterium RBG_19FT_COMBO_34_6]|uniref:Uncharacterized protein n=1 Tax=candidate division WWE3 bacterium RBG_19FT_COMBO_34_6 TaxID=1802612 RepID=A0A1F4UMR1_UNCKA|nr:MAG: hypothetical protein A2V49_02705 [candidate division WWE3 bacterium RBG_19FT_COMBO_34_6]
MRFFLKNNRNNPIFWIWIIAIYIFIIFAGLSNSNPEQASIFATILIVIAAVSFGVAYISYLFS